MLAVPTECSEADGYSVPKEICRLSRNATCLDAHPDPVLIHLITGLANHRHSALWSGLIISYLMNKNVCAVAYTACYMFGLSLFYSNFNP